MDPFPEKFSITDLESYSGVKAHTIRAWERRYAIMKPGRRSTNVRSYNIDELRNLLNVALLVQHGTKISKVARLSPKEREAHVRQLRAADAGAESELMELQVAMLEYDSSRFEQIARGFEEVHGIHALMGSLYLPLLQRIGTLWQSDTLRAGQEHMASNLIRQRIISAIAAQEPAVSTEAPLCVLYLPEQELHELGLLYLHFLLRAEGHRTIYLGQGVPCADLANIARHHPAPVTFIGVYSAVPRDADMEHHVRDLRVAVPQMHARFILTGARMQMFHGPELPAGMAIAADIRDIPGMLRSGAS